MNSPESVANPGGEKQEKTLDPRVESLAIPLARDYAEKNYPKLEDGTFQPAWRGVNGEKDLKNKSPEDLIAEGYSELAAREAVIDIANQPYNEYSEYWKEQNRGGAEFLISLVDERGAELLSALDLSDESTRAEYGDLIHENWISRNEWVKDPNYGDPKLACSFVELSPEEQQKDIDQLGVLQEWLAEQKGVASDHEVVVDQEKVARFNQAKQSYEKTQKRYESAWIQAMTKRNEAVDASQERKFADEVSRIQSIRDFTTVQYLSSQGDTLLEGKPDLAKEWQSECEKLEDQIFEQGMLFYSGGIMQHVVESMASMEKGASSEEIRDYIKSVSDARPYIELTIARYVAHFGVHGAEFAKVIGIDDLPEDPNDFYYTKPGNDGSPRGI